MTVRVRDALGYLPEAFSEGNRRVLAQLYPDAVIATSVDASVLGLNAVCDGTTANNGLYGEGIIDAIAAVE